MIIAYAFHKNKLTMGKKLIKHSPNTTIQSHTQRQTTFLVKSRTPYVSAMKQITKMLRKFDKPQLQHRKYNNHEYKSVKFITIKAAGRAIDKGVSIGAAFQDMGYKVDFLTGSVEVLDELFNESDDESEYQKRMVSYIESRVYLKKE